jgi:hypothetical protein
VYRDRRYGFSVSVCRHAHTIYAARMPRKGDFLRVFVVFYGAALCERGVAFCACRRFAIARNPRVSQPLRGGPVALYS